VCQLYFVKHRTILGGAGKIVEIDETALCVESQQSRLLPTEWISWSRACSNNAFCSGNSYFPDNDNIRWMASYKKSIIATNVSEYEDYSKNSIIGIWSHRLTVFLIHSSTSTYACPLRGFFDAQCAVTLCSAILNSRRRPEESVSNGWINSNAQEPGTTTNEVPLSREGSDGVEAVGNQMGAAADYKRKVNLVEELFSALELLLRVVVLSLVCSLVSQSLVFLACWSLVLPRLALLSCA
uniref:Uncharacterized protein n=1 Tax=Ditylenchus dipsaci TaxID=166011 RepID=A0A915DI49_9BILA